MSQNEARPMTNRRRRAGFTLVELLVVIGIIVILISILVPVVGRMKSLSQSAATQAQMASLAAACERYYADFRAYPGPLSNADVTTKAFTASAIAMQQPGNPTNRDFPQGPITSSENLVLGLMGGWEPAGTSGGAAAYDPLKVGAGPMSHNAIVSARRRSPAYVDNTAWLSNQASNLPDTLYDNAGKWGYLGSPVPEFMDRFGDPRPILYLRARVGGGLGTTAQRGVSADDTLQYNYDHLTPYKRPRGGSVPATTPTDFDSTSPVDAPVQTGPYAAEDYARYLSTPGATATATNGVIPPRNKDRFILISAGPDGVFGTKDDLFNQ